MKLFDTKSILLWVLMLGFNLVFAAFDMFYAVVATNSLGLLNKASLFFLFASLLHSAAAVFIFNRRPGLNEHEKKSSENTEE